MTETGAPITGAGAAPDGTSILTDWKVQAAAVAERALVEMRAGLAKIERDRDVLRAEIKIAEKTLGLRGGTPAAGRGRRRRATATASAASDGAGAEG